MIKVLLAEDSQVTTEYVKYFLEQDGEFKVIHMAKNGLEAVALAEKKDADVILMDVIMPHMNGFVATRLIMESNPQPIVIFSSSWKPDEVKMTFMALEAGALAVLEKPRGPGHFESDLAITELKKTLRLMSEVPVVRRLKGALSESASADTRDFTQPKMKAVDIQHVAIGASTGGPPVLLKLLAHLPASFPTPITVVQHIASGFLSGMRDWLDGELDLSVKVAADGEQLQAGTVYLAPDALHLCVTRHGRVALVDEPAENFFRPSVNHLFRSVAKNYGTHAVGILLTGMGRDGAAGLGLIQERGGKTFAQDKESSVVFGMAHEAVKIGAVDHLLPPALIGGALKKLMPKEKGAAS